MFTNTPFLLLVSSSSNVQRTQDELQDMGGVISQSGKLLSKYGRREFTDKILIFFGFAFFLACSFYVLQKRIFWVKLFLTYLRFFLCPDKNIYINFNWCELFGSVTVSYSVTWILTCREKLWVIAYERGINVNHYVLHNIVLTWFCIKKKYSIDIMP